MLSLVECLICTYVYEEKEKFIEKCPNCKNSDTEQTIYLAPESEIYKNYKNFTYKRNRILFKRGITPRFF